MTRIPPMQRVIQINITQGMPMQARLDSVASRLVPAATRPVPPLSKFAWAGDQLFVAGVGGLVQVDTDRPPSDWPLHEAPIKHVAAAPEERRPLFLGAAGEVFELAADMSFNLRWRSGAGSVEGLPDGSMLITPLRRVLFGTQMIDPEGNVRWRLRQHFGIEAGLHDVIVSLVRATDLECRSTATGKLLWTQPHSSPKLVADDSIWCVEHDAFVQRELVRGEARARIKLPGIFVDTAATSDGRGHLFVGFRHYWTIDLRTGAVLTRRTISHVPNPTYLSHATADGLLLRTPEHALYLIPPGDGDISMPEPLWRSKKLITGVAPHRRGLVVILDAPPAEPRTLHWLAPA